MPITNIVTHDDHTVRVHLTRGLGPHYAALRCVDCNRHIQWLSYTEAVQIQQLNKV
jgi:predicted nuclease of predicted toxin-antitoxin system